MNARLCVIALCALLAGCISLLPEPPPAPRLFALEGAGPVTHATQSLVVVIAVSPPSGEAALLGQDIVWRKGAELEFVAGSRWSARADGALQAMVIDTLEQGGGVRAAMAVGDVRSDYIVRWRVSSFHVEDSASSMRARFAAHASLVRAATREVVASTRVETEAPLSERSASLAVEALARAAREGSARIAAFAMETIAGDQSSAASISR